MLTATVGLIGNGSMGGAQRKKKGEGKGKEGRGEGKGGRGRGGEKT